ncbi:MAG: hypothetical protein P9M11_12065 [Candidatus Tenebribacter burtonii]|nr:hypothetical protein [Candidatus Tenebribacter burtonii]
MNKCIFCEKPIKYESIEHILPESLIKTNFTISGAVCSLCNNNNLSDLDNYFCHNNFGSELRVNYLQKTKKGKFPKLDVINGNIQKIDKNKVQVQQKLNAKNFRITVSEDKWTFDTDIVKRGVNALKISRFLSKVGLETLYYYKKEIVFNKEFSQLRKYVLNDIDKFIPFAWKKTTNKKFALLIKECVKNNEVRKTVYILNLIIYGYEYYIQLNQLDKLESLMLLVKEFDLNIQQKKCQIVLDKLQNKIVLNKVTKI